MPEIAHIASSAQETLTAAPGLICYNFDEDPDQGVISEYCSCNGMELP